jgi:hypothetical protein
MFMTARFDAQDKYLNARLDAMDRHIHSRFDTQQNFADRFAAQNQLFTEKLLRSSKYSMQD